MAAGFTETRENKMSNSTTVDVKKVLIVGGISHSLVNFRGDLIRDIQARGMQVSTISGKSKYGNKISKQLPGVAHHEISLSRGGINPFRDLITFIAICKTIAAEKPDLVISYTIKPVIYACLAARLLGISNSVAIITGLGFAFAGKSRMIELVACSLYRIALQRVSTVIFQNPDDMQEFRRLGITSEKTNACVILGSGVNTDHYSHSVTGVRNCFLFIGRLLESKGIRHFVEAARELAPLYKMAKFEVVGWSEDSADSISMRELESWKREGVVTFHDYQEDVRPMLNKCSVFVLPSYREGVPRTVQEAMATGRAIITTDTPGCRETVDHGKNGYLIEARSTESLVQAMRQLLDSPEKQSQMGLHSRRLAEERFEVRIINKAYLAKLGI